MRVPEKYSTLPAEDRSVHIVNICAIEDLGYLPSEGTVSSGAATGDLPTMRKALGASHPRTCGPGTRCCRDQVHATDYTLRVLPLAERSARGPQSIPGVFAEPGPGFAASLRSPSMLCPGSPEYS